MMYLVRYLKNLGNAKWQYEEYRERDIKGDTHPMERALYRQRMFPQEYKMWAIYRVSDMRIMAQSKNYHYKGGE